MRASTGLKLDHSSGSGLVDDSVTALLTSDGITLAQGKTGTTLSAVVLDTQRLGGDMPMSSVGNRRRGTETFSLGRGHDGRIKCSLAFCLWRCIFFSSPESLSAHVQANVIKFRGDDEEAPKEYFCEKFLHCNAI